MDKDWKYPLIDYNKSGRLLFIALYAMNISPKDAAEYLGYSEYRTIYKWKAGRSLPNLENLYAFSRLVGIPMDMLIIGEDENWKYEKALKLIRIAAYFTRIKISIGDIEDFILQRQ
ncbi:MAG: helix-turn-helix domain-containing protein [Lachnospiraceae bacterium]|nr:helix-turn-helix domain-containing protein [Lachnospiraceae bacterium]